MKILTKREVARTLPTYPVYEFGSAEPVGYIPYLGEAVYYEEEWRCGYCHSLVVNGLDHCPHCGGEY